MSASAKTRGWAVRAALALVVATLFFGRQIALWSAPGNRYLYHWQRSDALWLIGSMLLTAGLLLALARLARTAWPARGLRLVRWGFVVVLVQLVVALLLVPNAERPASIVGLASVLAAGLTVVGLSRAEPAVVRSARTACLILSPLPLILFAQIVGWRSWTSCEDLGQLPPSSTARTAGPVVLVIFDEWPLEHSWASDGFRPELPHLRALAERSFVFTGALAPGTATYESIPRLLFAEHGDVEVGDGVVEWVSNGVPRSAGDVPNLFSTARARDYRTIVVGWYLPYAALLAGDLDFCEAYPETLKRDGPIRLWDVWWANLQFLPDPLSRALWRRAFASAFSASWHELQSRLERRSLAVVGDMPWHSLALLHFPLPHAPFVFDAAGNYRGPYRQARMQGTVADQDLHLRYLDLVVGRLTGALARHDKLEPALLIVTSDHGWKLDPDHPRSPARVRRVPLVVKWPGQRVGVVLEETVCLIHLGRLVDRAIGGPPGPVEPQTMIEHLTGEGGDDCES